MIQTVSEKALSLVEKRLVEMKGNLSVQDAAAATGLIVGEAESALMRLMELYTTRITTDDNGTLLFSFAMPLRPRDRRQVDDSLWLPVEFDDPVPHVPVDQHGREPQLMFLGRDDVIGEHPSGDIGLVAPCEDAVTIIELNVA